MGMGSCVKILGLKEGGEVHGRNSLSVVEAGPTPISYSVGLRLNAEIDNLYDHWAYYTIPKPQKIRCSGFVGTLDLDLECQDYLIQVIVINA